MRRLSRPAAFLAAIGTLALVGTAAYIGASRGGDEQDSNEARAARSSDLASCAATPVPERSGTFKIGGFANLVAFGEGTVWTLTEDPEASGDQSTLTVRRIDPAGGNRTLFRYRGRGDARLAVGGHALWLADPGSGTLRRVDLVSGRQSLSTPFGPSGEPTEVAVGRGFLWLVANDDGRLAQVDLGSGSVVRRIAVPRATALADVAIGAGFVWVTTADTGMVARVDPRRGTVRGKPTRVGREALTVAVGTDAAWVHLGEDDTLVRVDPRSGRATERVDAGPNVFDLVTAYGAVWASNYAVGTVTRVDVTGRRAGKSEIRVGRDPKGLAVGAGSVWVANAGDCSITRIPGGGR